MNKIKEEREWWDRLAKLSDDNDVEGFYKSYAKYLEWNNVISNKRRILHKMSLLAAGVDSESKNP